MKPEREPQLGRGLVSGLFMENSGLEYQPPAQVLKDNPTKLRSDANYPEF